MSKGAAIREILPQSRFSKHFPIYLGDDVTGETAFQVLQGRGLTVKVGVSHAVTAASYPLSHPEEVRHLLTLFASHMEVHA